MSIFEFEGYHRFRSEAGDEYGSFEVMHFSDEGTWWWQACFPGCLPDGDLMGPFSTAEEAFDDARECS